LLLLEFDYILECDKDAVAYIDDESIALSKNTLLVRKIGQVCNTRLHYKAYYLHLSIEKGSPLWDEIPTFLNYYTLINASTYQGIFEEFIRYNARNMEGADNFYSLAKIFELLHCLRKDTPRNENSIKLYSGATSTALQTAVTYMKSHYRETIYLEDLGHLTGYSPNHFRKLFSDLMGISPQKYIEELRLRQAKFLLISTTYSLAEISYSCGFSSQAYFSLVFKNTTGQTPNAFRKIALAAYKI